MKKLTMIAVFAMMLSMAGSAFAIIDWAGNVWPNHGTDIAPSGDVAVYAQVYKSGVTDGPGAGADIMADIQLMNDLGDMEIVPMVYLGEQGSNDEYTANIPQAFIAASTWVSAEINFHDLTDMSVYHDVTDQAGNVSPFTYNVLNILPNDIEVTFSICMSGTETMGDPCVIGSAAQIGAWDTGVNMTQVDGDLYEVVVLFEAGSAPAFEYKFKKDGCTDWEGVDNRNVVLPTDGTTAVVLETQSWNNTPMGCGNETYLLEDKEVCFQVCVGADFQPTSGLCVIGNIAEIGNWGAGLNMVEVADNLWHVCVTFDAGTAIPVNVEYKYKKDGCADWESVDNRLFVVDNNLAAETYMHDTWNNAPAECSVVATESSSWDNIKSMYR
jgi:hypothetical protein